MLSPLEQLPHEILTNIFSFLLPGPLDHDVDINIYNIMASDILPLNHTCSTFRNVIRNNEELWKYCFFDLLYGWMECRNYFSKDISVLMREGNGHEMKNSKILERQCFIYEIGYHTLMKFIRQIAGESSKIIQRMTLQHPPTCLHQISQLERNLKVDDSSTNIADLIQQQLSTSTLVEWVDLVFTDLANIRQLVFMSSPIANDRQVITPSNANTLSKLENLSIYMEDCTTMLPILVCRDQCILKKLSLSVNENLKDALQKISNFASRSELFRTGLTEFEVTNVMPLDQLLQYRSWNKSLVNFCFFSEMHEIPLLNQFDNIQYLSCMTSGQRDICLDSNLHLPNLTVLNLSGDINHLTIRDLNTPKLESLTLCCNSCTFSEDQYFPSLISLSCFKMNYNQTIERFIFKHKTQLHTLDLQDNDMDSLAPIVINEDFSSVKQISLRNIKKARIETKDTLTQLTLDQCEHIQIHVKRIDLFELLSSTKEVIFMGDTIIEKLCSFVNFSELLSIRHEGPGTKIRVKEMKVQLSQPIEASHIQHFSANFFNIETIKGYFQVSDITGRFSLSLDNNFDKLNELNNITMWEQLGGILSSDYVHSLEIIQTPPSMCHVKNCKSLENIMVLTNLNVLIDWENLNMEHHHEMTVSCDMYAFPSLIEASLIHTSNTVFERIVNLTLSRGCFCIDIHAFPNLRTFNLENCTQDFGNILIMSGDKIHKTIKFIYVRNVHFQTLQMKINAPNLRQCVILDVQVESTDQRNWNDPRSHVKLVHTPRLLFKILEL
ncbi:hypothetical protein C9374_002454 [Naegleria lovaniensis]|uniref:F-box domain-containing protein n=1 Tax=Naegleria lovaniensis TaxID=51637 RepID=A0AA88KKE8_NAELO|nr:uncharacterized protein C9374_002454 [Naegleria lovaniensis]KAG2386710.1 hypothetical protein C9374_002454 [Naegleria lovaniensis]